MEGTTYIINTGCSYGVLFRSMKEFTQSEGDFKIIDLHCDSFGADFQKRTILYTIQHLFSIGVKPENISVICEWSQPNRLFVEIPQEFSDHILKTDDDSEGAFILNSKFELESENKDLLRKFRSIYAVIGDRAYLNPDVDNFDELLSKPLKRFFERFKENMFISNKPIDRFESYLTNILDLQSFLKSHGIDYVFFLMNNVFEGYEISKGGHHIYTENYLDKFLNQQEIVLPDLHRFDNITDFSSYLQSIWKLIDFDKFVFYKTDRFEYGGIDEYSMEKFGHISYTAGANPWDLVEDGYVTYFGAHPHDSIYINFFEEYIYPRVKHIVGEMKFDYTDRWSRKKHNAIRQHDS